ncbi:MAG TPA: ABC transporter ATP-binding protein [Ktedonobacteraceae bacterium]|jgi:ABC-2 type transport system ATP-binding protein|nr:ABC transporter ATP-binding protein [Ktedonobacteraceae bacterium]
MLVMDHVGKRYRNDFWGLQDFTLELGSGVLGLLGPNGAGKSTLMRILATITKPTEGRITWEGMDIRKRPDRLRNVMGYLPQDFGVYPHLTALEFLQYMAAIKGLKAKYANRRIDELVQTLNLVEARKRPLGGFSGGMRQRVGIAQALLNDPALLIVDEPTVGLDPEERVRFRNLLSDLSGERTVILSTHIVSDVEATATDIVMMNKGHLLVHALPEDLLSSVEGKVWEMVVSSSELPLLRERYVVGSTVRRSSGIHVRIVSDVSPGQNAVRAATTSLEDAYLYFIADNASHHQGTPAFVAR